LVHPIIRIVKGELFGKRKEINGESKGLKKYLCKKWAGNWLGDGGGDRNWELS